MPRRFLAYHDDPVTVARNLLGQRLVRVLDGRPLSAIIDEVEAYLGAGVRAAHTFNGRRTDRNESMYLGGGFTYVYFTYGMHHCLNVVSGRPGDGTAVLLRALEPVEGRDAMYARRPAARRDHDLCSGPGKLTQALALDRTADRLNLRTSRELFVERVRWGPPPRRLVARTPRIGVDYSGPWAKRLLRFILRENPHVSRR